MTFSSRTWTPALLVLFASPLTAGAAGVAWIGGNPGETAPGHVISPAMPSPADVVTFTLNADGKTYSNDCYQLRRYFANHLTIGIDESSRTINVSATGQHEGACLDIYMPVTGLRGQAGPLTPGLWTVALNYRAFIGFPGPVSLHETYQFTVAPFAASDFDENGVIDGGDLLAWQRGAGIIEGADHGDGDADDNGAVDALDLDALMAAMDHDEPAIGAIPEPSTVSILAAACLVAQLASPKLRLGRGRAVRRRGMDQFPDSSRARSTMVTNSRR